MLMLKIMLGEKQECLKDPKKDGMEHTHFSVVLFQNNNRDIETILRLILKKIEKMKDFNSSLISNKCWLIKDIVLSILIFNKHTQQFLKMIKHHTYKRRLSNLNIEELWISLKIMIEEIKGWLKVKKQDSLKKVLNNLFKIILKILKNMRNNT